MSFSQWDGGDQVEVKSGFATGYCGEGPRRFSYVLQILDGHGAEIVEHDVPRSPLDKIDDSAPAMWARRRPKHRPVLCQLIQVLRLTCLNCAREANTPVRQTGVFANNAGRPRCQETILQRRLKPVAERAGIGKVGWHTFRLTLLPPVLFHICSTSCSTFRDSAGTPAAASSQAQISRQS